MDTAPATALSIPSKEAKPRAQSVRVHAARISAQEFFERLDLRRRLAQSGQCLDSAVTRLLAERARSTDVLLKIPESLMGLAFGKKQLPERDQRGSRFRTRPMTGHELAVRPDGRMPSPIREEILRTTQHLVGRGPGRLT